MMRTIKTYAKTGALFLCVNRELARTCSAAYSHRQLALKMASVMIRRYAEENH